MPTESEKLIEEVARAIYEATPRNKPFDILSLWKRAAYITEARAVTALIVERCAKYHDDQVEGYRTHAPLPGEDSYEFQIRFHECSAGQIRSLSPDGSQGGAGR